MSMEGDPDPLIKAAEEVANGYQFELDTSTEGIIDSLFDAEKSWADNNRSLLTAAMSKEEPVLVAFRQALTLQEIDFTLNTVTDPKKLEIRTILGLPHLSLIAFAGVNLTPTHEYVYTGSYRMPEALHLTPEYLGKIQLLIKSGKLETVLGLIKIGKRLPPDFPNYQPIINLLQFQYSLSPLPLGKTTIDLCREELTRRGYPLLSNMTTTE